MEKYGFNLAIPFHNNDVKMTCIEFLFQANYADNVKSVEFIILCNIWCPYHKWLYIYKGRPRPCFS